AGWIRVDGPMVSLDPRVVTDFDLLHRRLAHAMAHRDAPDAVIPVVTEGLGAVTGARPSYPWLGTELGPTLRATVVGAALLLAESHLALDQPAGALAATARALALEPAHPGLVALRLHAHAQAGQGRALAAEYRAFRAAERSSPFWSGQTNRAV